MEYKTIAGIVTLIVMIAGGSLYIQDTGTRTGCRSGWNLIEDSTYGCTTASGVREQLCFKIYDSSNTENYWCDKGVLVEQPKEVEVFIKNERAMGDYVCSVNGCEEQ